MNRQRGQTNAQATDPDGNELATKLNELFQSKISQEVSDLQGPFKVVRDEEAWRRRNGPKSRRHVHG